jgi:DNA-binding transcriptional ArsR family regulator
MDDERFQKVNDAKTLRALAHPTRMLLMELLARHTTLTATQASELIGESPTNCAFHLRTLAKYGLIVEAEGGQGRERPWRRAQAVLSLGPGDSPAAKHAAKAFVDVYLERRFRRIHDYVANKELYPQEIRDLDEISDSLWWVTPEEMRDIKQEIFELFNRRYLDRGEDPKLRPEGAVLFEGFVAIRPADDPPTTSEHDDTDTRQGD